MKVSELIELLGNFDADAEVVLTTQPNYPMEHTVSGVARRNVRPGSTSTLPKTPPSSRRAPPPTPVPGRGAGKRSVSFYPRPAPTIRRRA